MHATVSDLIRVGFFAGALVACATPAPPPLMGRAIRPEVDARRPRAAGPGDDRRSEIVRCAQGLLSGAPLKSRGIDFPPDAVGFVRACYWQVEIDLYDATEAADTTADGMQILYRSAASRGWLHTEPPRPGDLVFFDPNDRGNALIPTQVAIIEKLGADGTLSVLGAFVHGPERVSLNLRQPDVTTTTDGRRINDLLSGEATLTAAQLFRSFADPFRGE
jgi:hypothetical protein